MWDGFNKRKFPRVQVGCELVIAAAPQKKPISAITDNVGIGGVAVVLPCELKRFEVCGITLKLTDSVKKPIKCQAKAVWVIPTQTQKSKKPCFDVGLEFLDLASEDLDRIKQFLDELTQKV